MILRFKKDSEIEKEVLNQIAIRDSTEKEAIDLIKKHTGIAPTGFGYHWGFGSNYRWSVEMTNFPAEIKEVEGMTLVDRNAEHNMFKPNGRTKMGKQIRKDFSSIGCVSADQIEKLGVPTHHGNRWSHFHIGKDGDGAWMAIRTDMLDYMEENEDVIVNIDVKQAIKE